MKSDEFFLLHIRDAIASIEEYIADGEEFFYSDKRTQDAVIRNFEVLGEAVKKLSDELIKNNPDIPWRKIAGMRDKIIHDYFGVNLKLVYETAIRDIPLLKKRVEVLLRDL